MAPRTLTQMHQSTAAGMALSGTWKLEAGRAITLQPTTDGTIRVAHGRLWVTFDGPHAGPANDWGDRVIGSRQRIWVRAGQRVVVQPWDTAAPAWFSWDPVTVAAPVRNVSAAAVMQPLADLRLALAFGTGAFGRLAAGVARLAWHWVAVRQRPCPPQAA